MYENELVSAENVLALIAFSVPSKIAATALPVLYPGTKGPNIQHGDWSVLVEWRTALGLGWNVDLKLRAVFHALGSQARQWGAGQQEDERECAHCCFLCMCCDGCLLVGTV